MSLDVSRIYSITCSHDWDNSLINTISIKKFKKIIFILKINLYLFLFVFESTLIIWQSQLFKNLEVLEYLLKATTTVGILRKNLIINIHHKLHVIFLDLSNSSPTYTVSYTYLKYKMQSNYNSTRRFEQSRVYSKVHHH